VAQTDLLRVWWSREYCNPCGESGTKCY